MQDVVNFKIDSQVPNRAIVVLQTQLLTSETHVHNKDTISASYVGKWVKLNSDLKNVDVLAG